MLFRSATLKTAGTQTITATDTTTPAITDVSNNVTVTAGAATNFLVNAPAGATAGVAFNFTVTARDQFNNTATGYTGTVHFDSTDPQDVMPVDSTLVAGFGTFSATLKTAGLQTLTATDTLSAAITGSDQITVSSAAVAFMVVAPATATAGVGFSFTVTAIDQFNNPATGYSGTVHFTSTDGQASLPVDSTLTNGVGSFNATLKTSGNQRLIATDTLTTTINGTSNTIAVSAAAATRFTVNAPATATAGSAFSFSVIAFDAFNNTATGYVGTVQFTSSDGQATLPPPPTTLVGGQATFSATLKTAGNQTLTATDSITPSITGFDTINVVAGAATRFDVSAPGTATAGIAVNITVTARDQFNNTASGYTGTVAITTSDPAATLPPNNTLAGGVGTFSVTFKTAGNRTVTATDTASSAINGTSGPVNVVAGAATHFNVVAPGGATAGNSFTFSVTALDAFNNTATGYSGSVSFSSTDPAGTVPGVSTLSGGTGTFNATLKTAGVRTITATDTQTASINGTSGSIGVSAATATHFTVASPAGATGGVPFNFTVTARDAFENVANSYNGTVQFTSSDGTASLPPNSTLTAGVRTFSATLNTAGNQTITATDTITSSITGVSGNISVSAAAVSFAVTMPDPVTAGAGFTFSVTALDQSNNPATGYTGTVHFTSTDPSATLPSDITLVNGQGVFNATLKTAGVRTITATDTQTSSITGNDSSTVLAAAVNNFLVTAPASAVPGTTFSFTVTARDQFSNTVTGYTGTVDFTSSDGAASLPPDATLTNGTGSFNATLNTVGGQTITATDTATPSINGTSNTISVGALAATHFSVTAPANATAGTPFSFTVQALDQFNNPTSNYSGTVTFTSSDGQASLPGNVTLVGGTGNFSATLRTAGSQTITARDTASSAINGTSGPIVVASSAATTFLVTAPASATAGSAFNFTVTAFDGFGNTATGYSGAVVFTSNDPAATLPGNSTLTNGTGIFSATMKTSGSRSITATDSVTLSITDTSDPIAVSAAAAIRIDIVAPSAVTAQTPFNFTVTAFDQFNNTATGYAGIVHFTSSNGGATLPADSTLTNGTRTFSATLSVTSGSGTHSLTATDTVSAPLTDTANISANPVLAVSNLTRTRWTVGRAGFDGTMTVSGGTGAITIQTSSGIPTGLTPVINGNTISFTGTPTAAGNFTSGSITLQDSVGATVTKTFGIEINAAPTLGNLSQTAWTVNQPGYTASIPIVGGTDPFSNLVVTGLPAGITATLNGTSINLAGTPTASGTFSVTASVTDVAGATATRTFSLVINPPITITPATLPDSATGTPYSQTVTANGGTGDKTVTYSVTGTLPPGLSISPASPTTNSFTISGTPTGPGSATINVTATDSTGATTTSTITLTGNGADHLDANRPRWDRHS